MSKVLTKDQKEKFFEDLHGLFMSLSMVTPESLERCDNKYLREDLQEFLDYWNSLYKDTDKWIPDF